MLRSSFSSFYHNRKYISHYTLYNSILSAITRQQSTTIGEQEGGTCYAHAVTRVITRLLKVQFPELFPVAIEMCSVYYNIKLCKNIFSCFVQEKGAGKCGSEMDKYGWKEENISALLFTFIYNCVTNIGGCDGGSSELSLMYALDYFRDPRNLTNESVKEILVPPEMQIASFSETDIRYFDRLIADLRGILNFVNTSLYNNTFKPLFYSGIFAGVTDNLQKCLDRGLYVSLTLYGHAITVTGYDKDYLIVKNSWGEASRDWENDGLVIIKGNKISIRSLKNNQTTMCNFIIPDEGTSAASMGNASNAGNQYTLTPRNMAELAAAMSGTEKKQKRAIAFIEKKLRLFPQYIGEQDYVNSGSVKDIIPMLFGVVRSGTKTATPEAITLLEWLMDKYPSEIIHITGDHIRVLIGVVQSGNKDAKRWAIMLLHQVVKTNDAIKDVIVAANGINVLIQAVQSDNQTIQFFAIILLKELTLHNDVNERTFADADGINVVLAAKYDNQDDQKLALGLLQSLTSNYDAIKNVIVTADSINVLIRAVQSDNQDVQKLALKLLRNLTVNNYFNQRTLADANGINVLKAAKYNSEDTKELALQLVQIISPNPSKWGFGGLFSFGGRKIRKATTFRTSRNSKKNSRKSRKNSRK